MANLNVGDQGSGAFPGPHVNNTLVDKLLGTGDSGGSPPNGDVIPTHGTVVTMPSSEKQVQQEDLSAQIEDPSPNSFLPFTERVRRGWLRFQYHFAWIVAIAAASNRGFEAVYRLDGFTEQTNWEVPLPLKLMLIVARALTVLLVSARSTFNNMRSIAPEFHEFIVSKNVVGELVWLESQTKIAEALRIKGKDLIRFLLFKIQERVSSDQNIIQLRNVYLKKLCRERKISLTLEDLEPQVQAGSRAIPPTSWSSVYEDYRIDHVILRLMEYEQKRLGWWSRFIGSKDKPVQTRLTDPNDPLLAEYAANFRKIYPSDEQYAHLKTRVAEFFVNFPEDLPNISSQIHSFKERMKQHRSYAEHSLRLKRRVASKLESFCIKNKLQLSEKDMADFVYNAETAFSKKQEPLSPQTYQIDTDTPTSIQDFDFATHYLVSQLVWRMFGKRESGKLVIDLKRVKDHPLVRKFQKDHAITDIVISGPISSKEVQKRKWLYNMDIAIKEALARELNKKSEDPTRQTKAKQIRDLSDDEIRKIIVVQLAPFQERMKKYGFVDEEALTGQFIASCRKQKEHFLAWAIHLKARLLLKTKKEMEASGVVVPEGMLPLEDDFEVYYQSLSQMGDELKEFKGLKEDECYKYLLTQPSRRANITESLQGRWEKHFRRFGTFVGFSSAIVFSCLAGTSLWSTFALYTSLSLSAIVPLVGLIAFTTLMVSIYFSMPLIKATLVRIGRFLDEYSFKERFGRKFGKGMGITLILAAMAASSVPILMVATKGLLIKVLGLLSITVVASSPLGWVCLAFGLGFALFAAVGTAGMLFRQIEKLFSHAHDSVGPDSVMYKTAKAEGRLFGFYLKVSIAGFLAACTAVIAIAGDYFGISSQIPIFAFDLVMTALSFAASLFLYVSDAITGLIKAWDSFVGWMTSETQKIKKLDVSEVIVTRIAAVKEWFAPKKSPTETLTGKTPEKAEKEQLRGTYQMIDRLMPRVPPVPDAERYTIKGKSHAVLDGGSVFSLVRAALNTAKGTTRVEWVTSSPDGSSGTGSPTGGLSIIHTSASTASFTAV